jgi:hypothetical protein
MKSKENEREGKRKESRKELWFEQMSSRSPYALVLSMVLLEDGRNLL